MLIDFAGLTYDQAMDIVGYARPVRDAHPVAAATSRCTSSYGKDVIGEGMISEHHRGRRDRPRASISCSPSEGAQAFHEVASKYDILNNPEQHQVIMLLDGKEFHRAPISTTPNGEPGRRC